LAQNQCPWDEWTCAYASREGNLEMLQWARKNGCPWNAYTYTYAVNGRHGDIEKWARQN